MKAKFGDRLTGLRQKLKDENPKWTQGYVADLIGVARPTYTAYEKGTKQPPLETVNKLAELFDTSADYLLGRHSTAEDIVEIDGVQYNFSDENIKKVLELFSELPEHKKEAILKMMEAFKD